jgi:hypothetical protein
MSDGVKGCCAHLPQQVRYTAACDTGDTKQISQWLLQGMEILLTRNARW